MATVLPPEADLRDTSPYAMPSRAVRVLAGPVAALAAAAGIVTLPPLTGMTALQAHAGVSQAALVGLGLYMGLVDLRVRRIPNWSVGALGLIYVAATVGLLLAGDTGAAGLAVALSAATAGIMLVMHLIGGTGMGDVKLLAVAALATGAHGAGMWVTGIVATYLLAAVLGAIPLLLSGRRKARLPMAPYIVAGHSMVLIAGMGVLASLA